MLLRKAGETFGFGPFKCIANMRKQQTHIQLGYSQTIGVSYLSGVSTKSAESCVKTSAQRPSGHFLSSARASNESDVDSILASKKRRLADKSSAAASGRRNVATGAPIAGYHQELEPPSNNRQTPPPPATSSPSADSSTRGRGSSRSRGHPRRD